MTHTKVFIQSMFLAALLFSCANASKESNADYLAEPAAIDPSAGTEEAVSGLTFNSIANDANGVDTDNASVLEIISSSAAVENKKDTTRKFIRTADLKFRVKNVAKATYALEDIAANFEGFVAYTNLSSAITNQMVIPVSADSSLETIYYVVQNNMTLRVPNIKLDSALKAIAPIVDYLDYRIIKADDIQFELLENRLKQERSKKYQERISDAVDERGKKLQEITNTEDKILSKQEQADEALLANLRLKDKIAYSTIQLSIYQREVFRRELIANDKNIEAYSPGFFAKVVDALHFGWKILEGILLFLAKSWGVILFVVSVIALVRIVFFRRKSNTEF